MKVLNVNHILETSTGGGTAERTLQMSFFLSKENITCNILTTDFSLTQNTKEYLSSVNITALRCLSKRFTLFDPSFFKVNKLVREADIIHLMNHWTLLNAYVYLFIAFYRKPYVVCPAGALIVFGRSKVLKNIYNLLIGYRIIRNASFCIAVTKEEIPHFNSYGVSSSRVKVIPNGVRNEEFLSTNVRQQFRAKFNIGPNPFILFIGRLNLIKGPDLLIAAFEQIHRKFPNYNLVFAGPDEGLKSDLVKFSEEHLIQQKVKIIGGIKGSDKESAYQEASLLVIPSRKEAMSIVVLEAGIYGTPSVFTDQCGLGDLSNLGYGLEVTATAHGLASGIEKLLTNDENLDYVRQKLRTYILENFEWRSVVKGYINLYRDILSTETIKK